MDNSEAAFFCTIYYGGRNESERIIERFFDMGKYMFRFLKGSFGCQSIEDL